MSLSLLFGSVVVLRGADGTAYDIEENGELKPAPDSAPRLRIAPCSSWQEGVVVHRERLTFETLDGKRRTPPRCLLETKGDLHSSTQLREGRLYLDDPDAPTLNDSKAIEMTVDVIEPAQYGCMVVIRDSEGEALELKDGQLVRSDAGSEPPVFAIESVPAGAEGRVWYGSLIELESRAAGNPQSRPVWLNHPSEPTSTAEIDRESDVELEFPPIPGEDAATRLRVRLCVTGRAEDHTDARRERLVPSLEDDDDMPVIGEIRMFAGTFAPKGWAFCEGQLLSVTQHSTLFSVLGVGYGGDGRMTFGIPDLRGRAPVHPGVSPGMARAGVANATADAEPKDKAFTEVRFIIALDGQFPVRT